MPYNQGYKNKLFKKAMKKTKTKTKAKTKKKSGTGINPSRK